MRRRLVTSLGWRSHAALLLYGAIVGSVLWAVTIPGEASTFIQRDTFNQGRLTILARELEDMVSLFNQATYPAGAIVPYLQENDHVPVGWEVCDAYRRRNPLDEEAAGLEAISRLDLSSKFRQMDRWRLVWIQKLKEVDR